MAGMAGPGSRVSAVVLKPGGTLAAMASKEKSARSAGSVEGRSRGHRPGTTAWLIGYALPKFGSTVHASEVHQPVASGHRDVAAAAHLGLRAGHPRG